MSDRALSFARRLAVAILAMALMAPLGMAVAGLSGIGHRWIDLLAQFTGPALVAAVAGLIAAVALRAWRVMGAALVVCALVLAAGWNQWAPPRGQAEAGSPQFTLYSANLLVRNDDIQAITASIAASDADVIVLVEVGPEANDALDTLLAGYPHRVASRGGTGRSVIASRLPLRDIDLKVPVLHVVGAVAETPLGPVTVAGVHMTRPWPYQIQWEQIRQANGLSEWARSVDGPVIAAGDFNSVSGGRIGRIIQDDGGLIPAPGWPGTWPARLPAFASLTIDQVYRSPELAVLDRRLGLPMGSDHRPVITRFKRARS